ncbi:4Fe-4S dicluster domain-containing protein [Alkalicella caledoniensis]|uniref:4Fe-4S dicluster domain-containing protein n=1 Tax=Alkalicella caledoniensis TaxID=2731377 RepID=A0A7G9W7N3_ALKCA|nr:reductive dehalogenase domain-containing protein [Alkalicella caledoniensis]QNO14695.1 4Fe-4S dicluster domain-containing protein [Alkalicella caledoniensis]
MKRFDERDTIFARFSYKEGSPEYEDYYKRNPDIKEADDKMRQPPFPYGEGTATFTPLNSAIAGATFRFLADVSKFSEGEINPQKVEIEPAVITKKLKGLAKFYGAQLVGVTKLKEEYYYSHRGRKAENYGEEVHNIHKYAIVFATEMDKDMINRAPLIGEGIEVTKGYVNTAVIGMILSYYLRELGYNARNHMDGNYLLIAPLVAEAAGLGQIGRSGILITKKYGKRVRLGVVTTNLELLIDEREDFGITQFCEICGNCAMVCPGKAIPKENRKEIDGALRWKIEPENCFDIWKKVGTDCGVCISTCPFSQGVEGDLVEKMKGQPELMERIFKEFKEKHGTRTFNSSPHEWL